MPDLAATRDRKNGSCGPSTGTRWPPIRSGSALPVSRTRRISFTAADGLTANRAAAWRTELPPPTAATIRPRRSPDNAAVMGPPLLASRQRRITAADSVQGQTALDASPFRPAPVAALRQQSLIMHATA